MRIKTAKKHASLSKRTKLRLSQFNESYLGLRLEFDSVSNLNKGLVYCHLRFGE